MFPNRPMTADSAFPAGSAFVFHAGSMGAHLLPHFRSHVVGNRGFRLPAWIGNAPYPHNTVNPASKKRIL